MHFLALLNKQSGGGAPANNTHVTVTINDSGILLFLVVFLLVGIVAYLLFRPTIKKYFERTKRTPKNPSTQKESKNSKESD